jgi:putative transposase
VATDLKAIYSSATQEEAELNLELFAEKWDGLYPSIVPRPGVRSERG